jgi:hypothetical protein
MPGKRDKAGNLTRARPGTHIVMDLQCNRAQRGRWRRQAATGCAALWRGRKHDASRPESDCWRSRCAINAPRPLSHAWPPMPGQIHRSGPHGQFGPRRQPNTPAHGSRGRSRPKLRGHTTSRTDAPDLRPGTAHTSAAAWQASRHAEPQHCTGRQERSAARGSEHQESCAPAWSWPACRSAKGLHKPMTKKSGRQAARKRPESHLRLYKLQKGGFDEFIHNFA